MVSDLMTLLSNYAPLDLFPDRYEISELLSEGPNSTLYRGRDTDVGSDMVFKCFDSSRHGYYLREIAAAFGLDHRNLVNCQDTFYLVDGRACMVYDYIPGGTLAERLKSQRVFDLESILQCLRELLEVLLYLHGSGRIHCDIKPENVFIRPLANGGCEFVLGDLGAACFLRQAQEGQHTMASPAYVAPERLYDRFLFNSDLYSLGILGFELCTGKRPFNGTTMEISRAHLSKMPSFNEIMHPPLCHFLERLLEKDPKLRISDAKSALYLLDAIKSGGVMEIAEPVSAATPTAAATSTQADIRVECLNERFRFALTRAPENLLMLHRDGQAVVGLEFSNHVELIEPVAKTWPAKTLIKSGPVQIRNCCQLNYATPSQVYCYDLTTQRRVSLRSGCEGLRSFYADSENLLWFNKQGGHYCDLKENTEVAFRCANFLLHPQACVLSDARFMVSGGALNERLCLRDSQANSVTEWALDGPILALTSLQDSVLAVTINIGGSERYSVWSVAPDTELKQHSLPKAVMQWCCTPGHVFWVTATGELYSCGFDLAVQKAGMLPVERLELISISANHRFVAAGTPSEGGERWLTIWENNSDSH